MRPRFLADADLKRRFAVNGKEPATVIVVTVEQAFQHCPKALVRSNLWNASTGGRPQGVPTLGDFVAVNTFLIQLYMPLNMLGFAYREIRNALVNMEKMFGLFEIPNRESA